MSYITTDYVETYIKTLLPQKKGPLKALRLEAEERRIPIISEEVQNYMEIMIQSHKIEKMLEIGTAIGYSSSVFAEAMGETGKIMTVERDVERVLEAKRHHADLGYAKQISVIAGDAQEVAANLTQTYDLIFLDGGKGHYLHLLEDLLKHLKIGGYLVSDNVLYKGMVANDDLVIRRKITIVKRMRAYLEALSKHPQLKTSVLPMGDGLAISYKTGE